MTEVFRWTKQTSAPARAEAVRAFAGPRRQAPRPRRPVLWAQLPRAADLPPIASTEWSEAARESSATRPGSDHRRGGGGTLDLDFGRPRSPASRSSMSRSRVNRAARLVDRRASYRRRSCARGVIRGMFVFSDPEQQCWHFISVRRVSQAERNVAVSLANLCAALLSGRRTSSGLPFVGSRRLLFLQTWPTRRLRSNTGGTTMRSMSSG